MSNVTKLSVEKIQTASDAEKQRRDYLFEKLYYQYSGLIYYVAVSIIRDPQLAEDVTQNTLMQIIAEIDSIRTDNEKELTRFICLITKNRTIDYIRKSKMNFTTYLSDECMQETPLADVESLVTTSEICKSAIRLILEMDIAYRTPLVLKTRGYSIKEISKILSITEANVKVRIYRARKKLFAKMQDLYK